MEVRKHQYKFGSIRSVDGNKLLVKVDKLQAVGLSVEVGAFVNCGGGHGDTLCNVNRVAIEENSNGEELQVVELIAVGSINKQFQFTRGIDRLPTLACEVFLLDGDQLNMLLGESIDNTHIKVGKRSMNGSGDVYLELDKLVGRHTAILGTTGSGKSSTVSRIIQSILSHYKHPRIIFFDIHNEYSNAFSGEWNLKLNSVPWTSFSLPYWYLDLEEFLCIYHPDAGSTQKMNIKNIIEKLKIQASNESEVNVTVDTPIYFDIEDLIQELKNRRDKEKAETKKDTWNKILLKIESINNDPRYYFLKRDRENSKDIYNYFKEILCLTTSKYVTVLDLSGLPAEVRSICIGVLGRLFFDFRYWDLDPENLPLSLVLEEAHSYIPEEYSADYSLCLERIEKIAKEGRKYGLGLIVVTQRPSNISPTVLSQCGTFIVLRLTSDIDQNKVKRFIPDTIGGLINNLSSLRDREGLISGDAVKLPGRVQFDEPMPWPKSNDVRFHEAWNKGSKEDLSNIFKNWINRNKVEKNEN